MVRPQSQRHRKRFASRRLLGRRGGADGPGWTESGGGWAAGRSSTPRGSKKGGVTQPELVLQVPEAGAVLGPFPEKVGLAVLPPLEHLRGGRGPVTPRKLSSRTAVAGLCVRKGKDARVRAAAAQSAALSYAAPPCRAEASGG